jgi:hypothetical protein
VAILSLLLIDELAGRIVEVGLVDFLEHTSVEYSSLHLWRQRLRMHQRSLVALVLAFLNRILGVICLRVPALLPRSHIPVSSLIRWECE